MQWDKRKAQHWPNTMHNFCDDLLHRHSLMDANYFLRLIEKSLTWVTYGTMLTIHCDVWFSYWLQWRHNERDGVSNHQPHDCVLNRFRRRSKKISKLRVTGLCEGNSPMTGEFPAQRASKCFHLMTSSLICVTIANMLTIGLAVNQTKWIKTKPHRSNVSTLWPSVAIRWQRFGSTLVQLLACCLTTPKTKPLPKPMLTIIYHQWSVHLGQFCWERWRYVVSLMWGWNLLT